MAAGVKKYGNTKGHSSVFKPTTEEVGEVTPPEEPAEPIFPGAISYGWLQSWVTQPSGFASIPTDANVVSLCFIDPATTYPSLGGNLNMALTGFDYWEAGIDLAMAIINLKAARPGIKVLACIGGADYAENWTEVASIYDTHQANRIAAVVRDFGFDGVDVNYEASESHLPLADRVLEALRSISNLREALGPNKIINYTGFSTGCYGNPGTPWLNSLPGGSDYATTASQVLTWARNQVPNPIDSVTIMAYDAGPTFDPTEAFDAYKFFWPDKPLLVGVAVPEEAWGGHIYTPTEVEDLAIHAYNNGGAGMAVWALDKPTTGVGSTPDSADLFIGIAKDTWADYVAPEPEPEPEPVVEPQRDVEVTLNLTPSMSQADAAILLEEIKMAILGCKTWPPA